MLLFGAYTSGDCELTIFLLLMFSFLIYKHKGTLKCLWGKMELKYRFILMQKVLKFIYLFLQYVVATVGVDHRLKHNEITVYRNYITISSPKKL